MAETPPVTDFACPRCGAILQPNSNDTICPSCNWSGEVYLFRPLPVQFERAEAALPDDATCVHHPTKRAVNTCAGTGDYICALCSVPVEGQTYSAQYLDAGGKKKVAQAFERYLPRPDSEISSLLALTFLFACAGVITIPYAAYRFFEVLKLRKTNPLYAKVVGTGRVVTLAVIISLLGLTAFCGVGAMIISSVVRTVGH